MRFVAFVFVSLLMSTLSFAASKYDYKKYWVREDLQNGKASFSFYTKNSPLKNINYIATMSVVDNKNEPVEKMLNILKKTLGQEKWSTDKIDGLEIYEKFDVSTMTLYRLAHNPKNKTYSLGSVKTRYLVPSYVELHLMQVESLTKAKPKTTAAFLYDLIFKKAVADNLADRASDYVINIGQQTLAPTNATIDRNTDKLVTATGSLGDKVEATGDKASAAVDRAGDKASAALDRAGDKVTSVASKKNIAVLSSVAALSSAATATLYAFVVAGSYKLARTAYYEMIGEFTAEEKKEKIDAFEASMKVFSEVSPQIEKLDQKLSLAAAGLKAITESEPTEVSLARLDADIAAQKRRLTEGSAACAECLEKEVLLKVKELEDMKDVIRKAGVDTEKKKGQICSEMDDIYNAWTNAESQMTLSRRQIIQNARVYMGLVNTNSKVDLSMQEQRKQNNACFDEVKSDLDKISASDKAACDKDPTSPKAVCRNLRAYRLSVESCQLASNSVVTEDLKASLAESAANFNSKIANLSSRLSKLDCDERAPDGTCIKAGAFTEISNSFKKQFSDYASQCPDRLFAKAVGYVAKPVVASSTDSSVATGASTQASAQEQKPSLWKRISNFFTSPKKVNEATSDAANSAFVSN